MFYVEDIISGTISKVYAVSEDEEGNIFFLFYDSIGWIWHMAENYKPI